MMDVFEYAKKSGTMRRGGPMDKIKVKTRCTACGADFNKSLRFFDEHSNVCAKCGGEVDFQPLKAMLKKALMEISNRI
jgi:rRNA maturation endonuclease Nob1